MIFGIVLFQGFVRPIVSVFGLSEEVTGLCVTALKIISIGFICAGVNVLLQGVCQAMGNGTYSFVISFLRLIVIVMPLAAVFATIQDAENFIWIVFPIAEAISLVVAIVLTSRLYRKAVKS